MPKNTHFKVEEIRFQNGDYTNAKPLVLSKYRAFSEIWNEYHESLGKQFRFMSKIEKEARKRERSEEEFDKEEFISDKAAEYDKEHNPGSYMDTLAKAGLVALKHWGVFDNKENEVKVDKEYLENTVDMDTLTRICEVAGSLKLGNVEDDVEGKAEDKV